MNVITTSTILNGVLSTTLSTLNPLDNSEESSGDSNEDDGNDEVEENIDIAGVYQTAEIAIPFAITILVIIILCATAVYAKVRRSRMQRHGQQQANMAVISGGVPMSTAAYQNHAFYPDNLQTPPQTNGQSNLYNSPPPMYSGHNPNIIPTMPMVYHPTLPYYSEAPPSYEDIAKDMPVTENVGNTSDLERHQQTQSTSSNAQDIQNTSTDNRNNSQNGNIAPPNYSQVERINSINNSYTNQTVTIGSDRSNHSTSNNDQITYGTNDAQSGASPSTQLANTGV